MYDLSGWSEFFSDTSKQGQSKLRKRSTLLISCVSCPYCVVISQLPTARLVVSQDKPTDPLERPQRANRSDRYIAVTPVYHATHHLSGDRRALSPVHTRQMAITNGFETLLRSASLCLNVVKYQRILILMAFLSRMQAKLTENVFD